ncbi:tetratricopeptide repeat protein [bacterium]|nr:tetratricopeptide repeat protein [bacterium]
MDQDWDRYRILGEQAEASSNYPYAEAMWAMTVLIAQHFGDKDPRTPYSLDSLSRSLMRQQKFTLAEHFLSKAWTIKTQVINASALEIATTMNLVAELYYRQGKYPDAIQMCKKVHGIYNSSYGPNHPKTHEIAGNIAMLEKMANPVSVQTPAQTPVQAPAQAPAPQPVMPAPTASTVSQAAVQAPASQAAAPAVVNPAPSTNKKRSGMPRCEVCGSVMEADWCFRCTGNSVKAVNPGQQLT